MPLEATPKPTFALSELGTKIFLDRYSLKDMTRESISPGDTVLLRVKRQTEVGVVQAVDEEKLVVDVQGSPVVVQRSDVDKPLEEVEDTLRRVAATAAGWAGPGYQQRFLDILQDFSFVPAGRILSALGGPEKTLTASNCYVIPSPRDTKEGIVATFHEMIELMSRGGGVGINLSSLRPRMAFCRQVNGRSSGAVSWGELYSHGIGLIMQGGSRRGAGMLMLADWHPDVLEFIDVKREGGRVTNANISVICSDEFMHAVTTDASWELKFPDTDHPAYRSRWFGDIDDWEAHGLPVRVWRELPARVIWDKIISSAHACAEPGLWFRDRANAARPGGPPFVCTNPCAEEPLPNYGVCNLGHINLSRFVTACAWEGPLDDGPSFNFKALEEAVRLGVRFLDTVVDASFAPLPGVEKAQHEQRRIGLGTLGLGDTLIRLGLRYGSQEALAWIDETYAFIARVAYEESIEMARMKGPYLAWDLQHFLDSGFGSNLLDRFPHLEGEIRQYGLRHACLLTAAPTGTVGTMIDTTTGIEPYFGFVMTRKSRLGDHVVKAKVVEDYQQVTSKEDLPDYFVTTMELTPEEHVMTQAAVQRWVDASVSKTCNLPSTATEEEVGRIYQMLYDLGCKGGTVYRDGSRSEQVLHLEEKAPVVPTNGTPGLVNLPALRNSLTSRVFTPVGTANVTVAMDEVGEPRETFALIGKSGSEIMAWTEAVGRLTSLVLRLNSPIPARERLAMVADQLRGIGGPRSEGLGPSRVSSGPDGIGRALFDVLAQLEGIEGPSVVAPVHANGNGKHVNGKSGKGTDICPRCGSFSLYLVSGCQECVTCDYSEC